MKNKQVFFVIMTIIFLIINAAAYFVLYAPLLTKYEENKLIISDRESQRIDLASKRRGLEDYKILAGAYQGSNQLYESLMVQDFDLEKSNLRLFFNKLGEFIGNDKIQADPMPEDQSSKESSSSTTKVVPYEISNIMLTFPQATQFMIYLLKSCDAKTIQKLPLKLSAEQSITEVAKPRLFLIKTLDIMTSETQQSGSDEGIPEDALQVRLQLDYVYFVPESN